MKIHADENPGPVTLPLLSDVEWETRPDQFGSLDVLAGDGTPVVRISKSAGRTEVTIESQTWQMPPSTDYRIIFDGPVIELFSCVGVFAAPIDVVDVRTISVTVGTCSVYPL